MVIVPTSKNIMDNTVQSNWQRTMYDMVHTTLNFMLHVTMCKGKVWSWQCWLATKHISYTLATGYSSDSVHVVYLSWYIMANIKLYEDELIVKNIYFVNCKIAN